MSKIMVVEDEASLREIYSIRITAEGYDVVTAGDGEEALAVAVREKPDLILSDVMMPKISGFDMLDILRSTPETADIKVIMMTALSADDQRQRGERLGANRYLVKSQVGIEDVINTIHEVLGDKEVASAPAQEVASAPAQEAATTPAPSEPNAAAAPAAPSVPQMPSEAVPPANPATTQSPVENAPIQPAEPIAEPSTTTPVATEPATINPEVTNVGPDPVVNPAQ